MLKRFAPLLAPALLALSGAAPAPTPAKDVTVAITTSAGTITVDLDGEHAPLTTANFLKYVDGRKFDGTAFYRSMHLDWGTPPNGLIQGGTQNDPKRTFKPVAHEPTSQTGLLHKRGTISMARFAPGTATGDFSIMLSDQPGLDAKPDAPDADGKAGFAAFGQVVGGMDVVDKIWAMPRSATNGVGVMKGQMLDPVVKIVSVRRIATPAS
ncbi:peptidylprolyl isomerase [Novosphingobium sp. 9U]|uniref:peptidylprolyl isomerase n=1 Tax=Novosphingobium sp. 9U TaxID=2653158 RepID=UPI0012F248EC|nr:peptidylprolyl isomerase [Novosphingobium sp. 9U]VWX46797.1 Peptidylprolyl isomerase [Novosphingobium sp. 9U]